VRWPIDDSGVGDAIVVVGLLHAGRTWFAITGSRGSRRREVERYAVPLSGHGSDFEITSMLQNGPRDAGHFVGERDGRLVVLRRFLQAQRPGA